MSGIYVMFVPDRVNGGEHIRKWSREPFEGATELQEAPCFVNDTDLGSLRYRKSWPRPATSCDLVPLWAGEFASFQDWVGFATQRLTGTYGSHGDVKAICVDARGRRCSVGADFSRAHEEGAFPVRYFFECIEPAAAAPAKAEDAA